MCPRLATDDRVDVRDGDLVLRRERSRDVSACAAGRGGGVSGADGSDVVFGEAASPALGPHVWRLPLVEVIPGLASNRVAQDGHGDAVLIGDDFLGLSGLRSTSGVDHDGIGKDGGVVRLSLLVQPGTSSASLRFVAHVVRVCAIQQMLRAAAGWVIACMARVIRDFATICQHISDAVGANSALAIDAEKSVLLALHRSTSASEDPARVFIVDDLDFAPESCLQLGQLQRAGSTQEGSVFGMLGAQLPKLFPSFRDLSLDGLEVIPASYPVSKPSEGVIIHGFSVSHKPWCNSNGGC